MNTEKCCEILKALASNYDKGSDEYVALEKAAVTLLAVDHAEIERRFEKLKDSTGLSEHEKSHLRRMGLL